LDVAIDIETLKDQLAKDQPDEEIGGMFEISASPWARQSRMEVALRLGT
jgi:hypothetical protein